MTRKRTARTGNPTDSMKSLVARPNVEWRYPGILRSDGKWETGPVWVEAQIAVPLPRVVDHEISDAAFDSAAAREFVAVLKKCRLVRAAVEATPPQETPEQLRALTLLAATKITSPGPLAEHGIPDPAPSADDAERKP